MGGLKFPDGFLWGTASAGYMTEGNLRNNDWYDAEMEDLRLQEPIRADPREL